MQLKSIECSCTTWRVLKQLLLVRLWSKRLPTARASALCSSSLDAYGVGPVSQADAQPTDPDMDLDLHMNLQPRLGHEMQPPATTHPHTNTREQSVASSQQGGDEHLPPPTFILVVAGGAVATAPWVSLAGFPS